MIAEAAHSGTDLVAALLTFYALRVAIRPADREHPLRPRQGRAPRGARRGRLPARRQRRHRLRVDQPPDGPQRHRGRRRPGGRSPSSASCSSSTSRAPSSRRAPRRSTRARRWRRTRCTSPRTSPGTLAVIIGLLLVRAGYGAADAWAALFVAVLVVVAAVRLMRQNVQVLMDQEPPETAELARAAIAAAEPRAEVRRAARARGRRAARSSTRVIAVAPDAAVGQGHAVADNVERAVHDALPGSDVTVHIEQRESARPARARHRRRAVGPSRARGAQRAVGRRRRGRTELSLHVKLPADLTLTDAHADRRRGRAGDPRARCRTSAGSTCTSSRSRARSPRPSRRRTSSPTCGPAWSGSRST